MLIKSITITNKNFCIPLTQHNEIIIVRPIHTKESDPQEQKKISCSERFYSYESMQSDNERCASISCLLPTCHPCGPVESDPQDLPPQHSSFSSLPKVYLSFCSFHDIGAWSSSKFHPFCLSSFPFLPTF